MQACRLCHPSNDEKSLNMKLRLAAVSSLRGQCKSWHRAWVPRLWDQRSQSENLL
jgi:hypothetical protein